MVPSQSWQRHVAAQGGISLDETNDLELREDDTWGPY